MKSAEQFNEQCVELTPPLRTPKWISVNQNVPEINHRVLLATNLNESIVTGNRLPPAGPNEPWFHTDTGYWCGTETVTHWMPLPKPPENP
jgi:hypothetical protein